MTFTYSHLFYVLSSRCPILWLLPVLELWILVYQTRFPVRPQWSSTIRLDSVPTELVDIRREFFSRDWQKIQPPLNRLIWTINRRVLGSCPCQSLVCLRIFLSWQSGQKFSNKTKYSILHLYTEFFDSRFRIGWGTDKGRYTFCCCFWV